MAIAEFEHDNVIPFEPVQRKARVRGKTISMKRFPKARLEAERLLNQISTCRAPRRARTACRASTPSDRARSSRASITCSST